MEFQFQRETFSAATTTTTKQGGTFRRNTSCGNKYVGVRQRPSGKWVAEIKNTTQKIRMWLGTFDTAEEAARAYDEAACLLRGNNTRTNFIHPPANSSLSFKIRNLLNQKKTRASKLNLTTTTTNKDKAKSQSSSTSVCTTSSSSSINSSSSQSSKDVPLPATTTTTSGGGGGGGGGFKEQMNQVFDGAYKPDLSYCCIDAAALEWGFDQYSFACEFDDPFLIGRGDYGWFQQEEEVLKRTGMSEPEIPMFEHMKVERQISASLYAMNGVNQYWDNVHDTTGDASFWDLSHMFCPS